jgi:EAL domain-containing protein (putative c-di-GMP-specific phosphodiesterase class I)
MFTESLTRSGRVTLAVRGPSRTNFEGESEELPLPAFANHAHLGSINWFYNYQNAVWQLPYATSTPKAPLPSFSSLMSGRAGPPTRSFTVDYSVDPQSIPSVSAGAVLASRFPAELVRGKDVIVGTTTDAGGDMYFVPGIGQMGGVFIHALGAETLKAGRPIDLGWLPLLLASIASAAFVLFRRVDQHKLLLMGIAAIATLVGPAALEARLIFVDVTPALLVLAATSAFLLRGRFRKRGLIDPVSGLPNLTALKSARGTRDKALIVARILNYAEIAATLPTSSERQLVEQIVSRLSVGARDRTFYQGDDGIFAWFDEPGKPFGHHLEALHALFRTPVRVNGMAIDLSISFGVEIGSGRSLTNRLASALVAAEEAAHDGLKWKFYDPEVLEDASWKLSILSQLDSAVDKGEVWVAYQPKFDLKQRKIVGAEALARWTHPEKGPIAASEFVAAAEQHDRIGKLTDFVLEQAISAAAAVNRKHADFGVAVNLSARLLTDRSLVLRLGAMLARHRLSPSLLTLELTETAELAGSGAAFDMLASLRDMGVTIAIDDYGTGLSTLDYLKKIPASEIKIDQSFVKTMLDNRSDLVMVQSTIALAHSLGRKVVAEGVEHQNVLDALVDMGCDVAQGYIIGRPMSIDSLAKRLSTDRRSSVA